HLEVRSGDLAAVLDRRHRGTVEGHALPDRGLPRGAFGAAAPLDRGVHVQPPRPLCAGGRDPPGPASHHARSAVGAGRGAQGPAPRLGPFHPDAQTGRKALKTGHESGVLRGCTGGGCCYSPARLIWGHRWPRKAILTAITNLARWTSASRSRRGTV